MTAPGTRHARRPPRRDPGARSRRDGGVLRRRARAARAAALAGRRRRAFGVVRPGRRRFLALERVAGGAARHDGWNTDDAGIHLRRAGASSATSAPTWEARLAAAGVAVATAPTTRSTCAIPKATASACRTGPTRRSSATGLSRRACSRRACATCRRSRSSGSSFSASRRAASSPAGWRPARPRSASWSGSAPATAPPRRPRRSMSIGTGNTIVDDASLETSTSVW